MKEQKTKNEKHELENSYNDGNENTSESVTENNEILNRIVLKTLSQKVQHQLNQEREERDLINKKLYKIFVNL